jgi:hypothetical protein
MGNEMSAHRRSLDLHNAGLSRTACERMTGVDPELARIENRVIAALWAMIGAGFAAIAIAVVMR